GIAHHLLHTTNIGKKRKRNLKMIHLKLQTGNMMEQQILLSVQIIEDYIIYTIQIGQINMALKGHLKSTRVKAVLIVLFAPYVQRQQKVKTENYFTMKNGNTKKNM